jgi:putative DNA methylase
MTYKRKLIEVAWPVDAFNKGRASGTSICDTNERNFHAAEQLSKWLLDRGDLDADWDPNANGRPTVWEATRHLIWRLDEGGEEETAELLRLMAGSMAYNANELAYRLFQTFARRSWAKEALEDNALGIAWPELTRLAGMAAHTTAELFEEV